MVKLPVALDKAYGVACLLAASVRTTPVREQPDDAFRPSRNLQRVVGKGTQTMGEQFSLGTWNVYEGRKPELIVDGIETILSDYGADVLALQEVPYELLLHERLKSYHIAFAPDNYEGVQGEAYEKSWGNALLSPHLLTDVQVIDLPVATWNYHGSSHVLRRNAIIAAIAPGVDASCAHLDLLCRPTLRAHQLAPALDAVAARDAPVSLLGMDANVIWQPFFHEPARELWNARGYRDPWREERRPFPAYVDQALACGAKPVVGRVLDLPGSDHRALLATFKR